MIPPDYSPDQPCYGRSMSGPEGALHAGHQSKADCYLLTWVEPPLRWVKRVKVPPQKPRYQRHSPMGGRCWHLILGIRRDSGNAQVHCSVGDGLGPFAWREKPSLGNEEPREHFCSRCLAEWAKEEVESMTVQVNGVTVTKGQLAKLLEAVEGTDLQPIELRPTNVEDRPALIAEATIYGSTDETKQRFLLIGDGVVRL